jgi:Flp pilus assembly protein TadD
MTAFIETAAKFARRALLCAVALTLAACAGGPAPKPSADDAPAATAPRGVPALPAGQTRLAQQRFDAALKLMRSGDRDGARAALQQLHREQPQLSGPPTNLGILYAQAGQRGEAISALSRAVALNPRNAVAHNWLGTLYREGGDYARAEQAYRDAIDADPAYATAYRNLGILYELSLRRPQDALAQYREYQRRAGADETSIVVAWIRNLEATAGIAVAGALP